MRFIVIMGCSKPQKLMPLYTGQLAAAGIDYHVENLVISSPSDGRMGWCLGYYRKFAEQFRDYDRLILTDAWDVLFYGTRESTEAALSTMLPNVTYGAELNCYPEPMIAHMIPDPSPWRFANGGCLTAAPAHLAQWCDWVERDPSYEPMLLNQQWLNRRLAEGSPLARIDSSTELFYCMFLEHLERSLGVIDGRPYNTVTGRFPQFIHFNGSHPHEPFMEMMKMSVEAK